jgi:diaminopimelate decarboxylase
MYDSYHHIVNISNPEGKKVKAEIVGNICETGDIFGKEREITEPREGDLLVIMTTGAYGSAMSSNYNFRPLAAEVMVDGDDIQLTRKRQTYEQMMENYVF